MYASASARRQDPCRWFLQWLPCYQPRTHPNRPWRVTLVGAQATVQVILCLLLLVLSMAFLTPENAQHVVGAKTMANLFHPDGGDFTPSRTRMLFFNATQFLAFVNSSVAHGLRAGGQPLMDGWTVDGLPTLTIEYVSGVDDYRALRGHVVNGTESELAHTTASCQLTKADPLGPLKYAWEDEMKARAPAPTYSGHARLRPPQGFGTNALATTESSRGTVMGRPGLPGAPRRARGATSSAPGKLARRPDLDALCASPEPGYVASSCKALRLGQAADDAAPLTSDRREAGALDVEVAVLPNRVLPDIPPLPAEGDDVDDVEGVHAAPPGCDGIKGVLWRAGSVSIEYALINRNSQETTQRLACHRWVVTQRFAFSHAGFYEFQLDMEDAYCSKTEGGKAAFETSTTLVLFICLFALASLVLNAMGVAAVRDYRKGLKAERENDLKPLRHAESGTTLAAATTVSRMSSKSRLHRALSNIHFNTPTLKRLMPATRISAYRLDDGETDSSAVSSMMSRLHDMVHELDSIDSAGGNLTKSYEWLLLGCLGDVLCLTACALDWALLTCDRTATARSALICLFGVVTFLQWAFVISHMGDQPQFYVLVSTLQNCVPIAMRYVVGCAPIFFGYASCGTYVWGPFVDAFATLDISCASLYAVGNGDVMHDFFVLIYPTLDNVWLQIFARVFLYSFVIVFMYLILNLFLAIMEDTYHQVKQALIEDLKDDLSDIRSSTESDSEA
eukprot:TRINITY_DN24665_c0_g1_i1.p1 TRINITY_DN24665_c0_g1~~TRINITY_DN24665_c0_g1_i1.p1  ORF type:complete len:754 (+),score=216.12 TRINITY_DN24665_c0_g1_i1:61-2262(+)